MTPELKDSELFNDMISGKSFCFVGDSITYGSVTDGIPWYKHLTPYIKGNVSNFSYGGWTSMTLLEKSEEIPTTDVYVIAIGINDVIYSEAQLGATTADDYIECLDMLTTKLKERTPEAKFYFITPWPFLDRPDEIYDLRDEFSVALQNWCNDNDRICIDPYPIIMSVLQEDGSERYMYNSFHPNASRGVGLFAYAVLQSEHQRSGD